MIEMESHMVESTSTSAQVSDALLDRAAKLPVAVLSDAMDGLGLPSTILDEGIRRFCGSRIAGRARTVDRMPAPPNAAQADFGAKLGMGTQVVIDTAGPRDIVVINARADCGAGLVGDNMGHRARNVGVVGFIVDGAVRDVDELEAIGLTVYARGVSPRQGMRRFVTTAVDQPILCGSVRVSPGDVIVADSDGVAVLPQAQATTIIEKAEAIEKVESTMKTFINGGNTLEAAVARFKQR
jgi:4-hydroxy-4-methyl-2-oxoglutarate aldolase